MLITERLTLPYITPDDWDFYDALLADPEIRRWDGSGRGTRFGRRLYFEADLALAGRAKRAIATGRPCADATYVVRLRHSRDESSSVANAGTPIGLISTCVSHARDRRAEIGFSMMRSHWSRGYATEAASAVITHLFESVQIRELCAVCLSGNIASARVLEKLGMGLVSAGPREYGPSPLFTVAIRNPERELRHYRLTADAWEEAQQSMSNSLTDSLHQERMLTCADHKFRSAIPSL